MARMCRKFHDHSFTTCWVIAMYISSFFSLYAFFSLSIISFGEKYNEIQRLLIMSIIQIYLFNIKEEKKRRIRIKKKKRKHLLEKVLIIFCLLKSFLRTRVYLSRHLFLFNRFFWKPRGVPDKINIKIR